ncbi:MAG: MBL fold metallo-hydrolase [Candidatus Hodarchaeales archaeon]|jgi:glyoxylase-like metal-dependent hydrolase (beta-lactamase superfamily II)
MKTISTMVVSHSPIIISSGRISNDLFHIDLCQFNLPRITSSFVLNTSKEIIILDSGTSNDVSSILEFFSANNLSLKKIRYIIPSHHHFDHAGGVWKLWKNIKVKNPHVKVLTTEDIKNKLQKPKSLMKRAKKTFGEFIGEMNPLSEESYEIVKPNETISLSGSNIN